MNTFIKIFFTITLGLGISAFACDFDGDGVADPAAYDDSTFTLNYIGSSAGLISIPSWGNDSSSKMVASKFLGTSSPDLPGFVDLDGFLKIRKLDGTVKTVVPFSANDVSFIYGHDFDGDGLDESMKITNRCNKFTKNCYKNKGSFVVLPNKTSSTQPNTPYSELIGTTNPDFTKSLAAVFIMDANNDGIDDVCDTRPRGKDTDFKSKKKKFKVRCFNVADENLITAFNVGKLFKLPESINFNGSDKTLLYRKRGVKNETKIKIIDTSGNKSSFTIPTSEGKVVIGDYLGNGYEQVAVAGNGQFTILDPTNGLINTSLTLPQGNAMDCKNIRYGKLKEKYLTSNNVCDVFNCL